MPYTITAQLPLGTYRGASADGGLESVPSVARLYSALLAAAGFGPRAVAPVDDDTPWSPCPDDIVALRWLEEHPPDAVSVPTLEVNGGPALAYRDDGTVFKKKEEKTLVIKKFAKGADVSVAVGGPFRWTWSQTPPAHVVAALDALCPDVSHLGTTESPVRLTTEDDDVTPTHRLDPDATLFAARGGHDLDVPMPGRFEELRTAHQVAAKGVSRRSKDAFGTDEKSTSAVPPREALALVRYAPLEASREDVPWTDVLLLPLDRAVPVKHRVGLAVGAHRALIAAIGDGAPPVVTGVYPEGSSRPANRLAIQVVDAAMPVDLPAAMAGAPAVLALLVPSDAVPADVGVLLGALSTLRSVRGRGGVVHRVTAQPEAMSGSALWRPPAPGMLRRWRTSPPALPDTRGVRNGAWTFAHAALLSLGYVWKDRLELPPSRGEQRQTVVVAAVQAADVAVLSAVPVRESDVRPYVHKVHPHAVVRPYRADLWLGDLAPAQCVQAIGQTRHLGGGLLVPVDMPTEAQE